MSKEAMKQALEALEIIKASCREGRTAHAENEAAIAQHIIKQALAQPEQEPVAWRNAALRVGEDLCSVGPFGYYDMTAEQWLDWALSVVTVHAPPPKREWQGLTDEEIYEMDDMTDEPSWKQILRFVRAVEAKLKEKNT